MKGTATKETTFLDITVQPGDFEVEVNMKNITSLSNTFKDTTLTHLTLDIDTSHVTNMYGMFYNCSALTTLDLGDRFDTSKVTNMSDMFYYCSNLTTLDLSNFDTSKVTNMNWMFYNCSALTSLNLSNFDTSKVTYMSYLFGGCSALTSLNLSNFDTSKVTNMSSLFYGCSALTSLNLSNFDTSKVTNMSYMFYNCSALTTLDLSSFDTSKVTKMGNMFYGCSALTSLNLSNFDTSNVTSMNYMFYGCSSLTTVTGTITVINYDLDLGYCPLTAGSAMVFINGLKSGVTGKTLTLRDTTYDLLSEEQRAIATNKGWTIKRINTVKGTISGHTDVATNLFDVTVQPEDFNDIQVNYYNGTENSLQYACNRSKVTQLTLDIDTSNVTKMGYLFNGCSSLTSLNLSSFDTSKVTNMSYMFFKCSALTSLNLSNFDTSKVTNMSSLFYGCSALTSLNLSNFDTSKVTNMSNMFEGCSKLTQITCTQAFKDWCITNQKTISLPSAMREGGSGTWIIIE